LGSIGADKARVAERQVGIEAHPRHRLILVRYLDASPKTRRAGHRGAGVTIEEQFRILA
jgi:hypothetical protein